MEKNMNLHEIVNNGKERKVITIQQLRKDGWGREGVDTMLKFLNTARQKNLKGVQHFVRCW